MRNLQQIPSHEKTMRLAFKASTEYEDIEEKDNKFTVKEYSDVMTPNGWVKAKELKVGDTLSATNDDSSEVVIVISALDRVDTNIVISYN